MGLELNPNVTQQLRSKEEVLNYLRERIADAQAMRDLGPAPCDLALIGYQTWERKLMIRYGQAMGAIMCAQAFGMISTAEFDDLKRGLVSVLLFKAAEGQLGG